MNRTLRAGAIASLIAIAVVVAACTTRDSLPPDLSSAPAPAAQSVQPTNPLDRQCQTSEGLYEGYRLSCEGLARRGKACPKLEQDQQAQVRGKAEKFCNSNRDVTQQNIDTVAGFVKQQLSIGRKQ